MEILEVVMFILKIKGIMSEEECNKIIELVGLNQYGSTKDDMFCIIEEVIKC